MKTSLVRKSFDNVTCLFISFKNYLDNYNSKFKNNSNIIETETNNDIYKYSITEPNQDYNVVNSPNLKIKKKNNIEFLNVKNSIFKSNNLVTEINNSNNNDLHKNTLNKFRTEASKIKSSNFNNLINKSHKFSSFEIRKKNNESPVRKPNIIRSKNKMDSISSIKDNLENNNSCYLTPDKSYISTNVLKKNIQTNKVAGIKNLTSFLKK